MVAAIPQAPDQPFRYLELGSGAGSLGALVLSRFPNAEATFVDGSSVMVEQARERLAPFGARATVVEANLAEPTWVDAVRGPFDGMVSTIAIHNLRDPMRIRTLYAEVCGLIADGGWFLNLDYTRAAGPLMGRWFQWAAAGGPSSSGRAGGQAGGRAGGRGFPGTLDEQLAWLREAGFAPVDCLWREAQLALMGGCKGAVRTLGGS
ncbi:MAG: Methyltransferase type 11 [Chloroflexi bacterium]|nr:Methyltransferase type 11 [Chloroflexota bacterium]